MFPINHCTRGFLATETISNYPTETVACRINLWEKPLQGTFCAKVLAGDSPDSYNDIEHPRRVKPEQVELTFRKGTADLPPHSVTIFHVVLN
jgi:hypothetical protein